VSGVPSIGRLALGFIAGFLATLIFHQIGIWVLHATGVIPFAAWATTPIPPFGVPQVISLAFWGGVWGILFVLIERWLAPLTPGYWISATLFGAIFPTLVLMFIVLPLKGRPLGGGFLENLIATFLIAHGLWGLGTAVFLGVLSGWRSPSA
jgi:hypothetical protein